MLSRIFRPVVSAGTYRAVAFYVAELAIGAVAFAVLLAGWILTLCFSITPLVVPLLIALRVVVGSLARAEAELARVLLGVRVHAPISTPGTGFWSRGFNVLRDRAFWRQQAHLLLAWPKALVPLTAIWWGFELLSLPGWYQWVDSSDVFGFVEIDSLAEALPFAGQGLVLLLVVAHLLGPYTRLTRWLATRLLTGDRGPERTAAELRAVRLRGLTIVSIVSTAAAVLLVVIWQLTTPDGYFWPIWPLLALSLVVGIPGWIVAVLENDEIPRLTLGSRALAIQIGVSAILVGFLVAVWAITTGGYFWPIWPALCLAFLAVVHAALVYGRRVHRIEELEESRAAAVNVQETELQRIERDLHDGAQARLVALGMSLGMAEDKVRNDPEGAIALLAEARSDAKEALEELRDLARGIRPPILTDRGLEAAVASLAVRSPIPVDLSFGDPGRHTAAVETAAYFVAAEALTNAIKHSEATHVDIRVKRVEDRLVIEVIDDGRGGADATGNGLTGLRQRLAALDGTLRVASPVGGPTVVRAELPCE
jgi:signal transduction histidine kinase